MAGHLEPGIRRLILNRVAQSEAGRDLLDDIQRASRGRPLRLKWSDPEDSSKCTNDTISLEQLYGVGAMRDKNLHLLTQDDLDLLAGLFLHEGWHLKRSFAGLDGYFQLDRHPMPLKAFMNICLSEEIDASINETVGIFQLRGPNHDYEQNYVSLMSQIQTTEPWVLENRNVPRLKEWAMEYFKAKYFSPSPTNSHRIDYENYYQRKMGLGSTALAGVANTRSGTRFSVGGSRHVVEITPLSLRDMAKAIGIGGRGR